MNDFSMQRKIHIRALAILQRAANAGIPEQHMKIGKEEFASLLYKPYYQKLKKSPEQVAENVYSHADALFSKSFICIDGGNINTRKRAGFALLFRMIACDKFGIYRSCQDLCNKFQSFRIGPEGDRNTLVDDLKDQDILFISECKRSLFNSRFDVGNLFDELLGSREDEGFSNIISFSEPINKEGTEAVGCGSYLASLFQNEIPCIHFRVNSGAEENVN